MPREKSSTCRKQKKRWAWKKEGDYGDLPPRRDVCFSGGINDAAGAECATVHPVGGHLPRVRRYKLVYWY